MNVWSVAMFLTGIVLLWFAFGVYEAMTRDGRYSGYRRSESLNHLMNIALSEHNYAAQNDGTLTPHALVGPDGTEYFGWSVSLLPFLEATAVYERLELEKPWDDPDNRVAVSVSHRIFLNPRVKIPKEVSGYGMQHYAANSHVLIPGKPLTVDEISANDGLTNTIFFGEIGNHFQPWAAPGSLRDPAEGLGVGPKQFGMTGEDGLVIFAFADGSAKPVSRDVDPKILKAWATPDGGEAIPEQ